MSIYRIESMTLFNTLDLTHWAAWGDLLSTWKHKYSLPVGLTKTTQLPPLGKEYLSFQVFNKSPHAAQCVKSRVINKVINSILSINTFEQQCVVIKLMLQSSRLEDHMDTIGIDQSSFARFSFEHRCMNNIKILLISTCRQVWWWTKPQIYYRWCYTTYCRGGHR